jgi:probable F420-dependent oxidoreductase
VKFSISLPRPEDNLGPPGFDAFVELAQAVERIGFDAVSASDHPFPFVVEGEAGHQAYDPFVLLSYIGAATTRLELHFSLVIAGYRNPFAVARLLGTLDYASGGRVIAGLGAGYLEAEFDAVGGDYANRGAAVDQAVRALRAAWTGEPVTMAGPGWRARGNVMLPTPASSPHPPLWRGGNTRKAMLHAVRDFDGWTPFEVGAEGSQQTTTTELSLDTLPARMATLHELIEAEGRTRPLEVCYVRTSRRWLKDSARTADELNRFAAAGIDRLEFNIVGQRVQEWIDGLEAFAEIARTAGVLVDRHVPVDVQNRN